MIELHSRGLAALVGLQQGPRHRLHGAVVLHTMRPHSGAKRVPPRLLNCSWNHEIKNNMCICHTYMLSIFSLLQIKDNVQERSRLVGPKDVAVNEVRATAKAWVRAQIDYYRSYSCFSQLWLLRLIVLLLLENLMKILVSQPFGPPHDLRHPYIANLVQNWSPI